MCRDFESKIDGLERKQVDRTRAWQFEGTSRRDILVSEPWRFGTLGSSFLPSPIPCPCHLVLPMRRVDECLDYRAGCMQKISKVNPLLRGGWKESHLLHISQYLTMFVGGIWNCRWFFYLLIGVYIVIHVYIYYTIIKCVCVCVSLFLTFAQAERYKDLIYKIYEEKLTLIYFNSYVDVDFSVDPCLVYPLVMSK